MFTDVMEIWQKTSEVLDLSFGLGISGKCQPFAMDDARVTLMSEFSPERRAEFLEGRKCAHEALSQINVVAAFPMGITSEGAPQWPQGVVGSVSHKNGFAVAVASKDERIRGIGIDLEKVDTTDGSLMTRIFTPYERAEFSGSGKPQNSELVSLVFSIKEAYFKSLSPLIESRDLDFKEMEVELTPGSLNFSVRLLTNRFPDFQNHVGQGGAVVSNGNIFAIVSYKYL